LISLEENKDKRKVMRRIKKVGQTKKAKISCHPGEVTRAHVIKTKENFSQGDKSKR